MSFQPLGSQQVSMGSWPLTWVRSSVPPAGSSWTHWWLWGPGAQSPGDMSPNTSLHTVFTVFSGLQEREFNSQLKGTGFETGPVKRSGSGRFRSTNPLSPILGGGSSMADKPAGEPASGCPPESTGTGEPAAGLTFWWSGSELGRV